MIPDSRQASDCKESKPAFVQEGDRVRRAIEAGQPAAGENTGLAVMLMVRAIAGALVAYMIAAS